MINNKKSKILIGCLALLLVLSVGYAYFSQNITINGTATAKGSFDLTSTCEMVTEDFTLGDGTSIPASTGTGTCKVEGNKITTTSTFSKPSDEVYHNVTITNNGTIPAVLKTVDSSNNVDESLVNTGDVYYLDKQNLLMGFYRIALNGQVQETFGDSAVEAAKLVLQPNETITLVINQAWVNNEDIGFETQPKLPEEGATMNYNIVLGFEQIINE